MKKTALPFFLLALSAFGQTVMSGGLDARGPINTMTGLASAKPATCTTGQEYFASDATAGSNKYLCTSTNTWTNVPIGGGSGSGVSYCAPASASGTTYTCAPSPALTSYAAGATLLLIPDVAGTAGAINVNVNSLGNKAIKQTDGSTNPSGTSLATSHAYLMVYDGTVFRLTPGPVNALTVSGSVVGTSVPYMDGEHSCNKLTVLSTNLTGGVSTQEIPWLTLPAKSVIKWFRWLPNTLYTWASGSNTTMAVSLQQNGTVGSPTSYMFPSTSIQTTPSVAGTPIDDVIGVQTASSHTLSLNFLGSQNFSLLNSGGNIEFHICIGLHP